MGTDESTADFEASRLAAILDNAGIAEGADRDALKVRLLLWKHDEVCIKRRSLSPPHHNAPHLTLLSNAPLSPSLLNPVSFRPATLATPPNFQPPLLAWLCRTSSRLPSKAGVVTCWATCCAASTHTLHKSAGRADWRIGTSSGGRLT
eukprot:scaffold208140_cov31-Tisochrysis_lutea.AAC.1